MTKYNCTYDKILVAHLSCWLDYKPQFGQCLIPENGKLKENSSHTMAATKLEQQICLSNTYTKGQIISKCLFGVFNFFQKANENTSHSSKNEFIRSFFGRIHSLTV